MSRFMRLMRYGFLAILIATSTIAMTLYVYLHGSLPILEGNHIVPGLRAKVEIERDEQGVPTLSALHREDIAYGLGYLHSQERFFQMDQLRRQSAGELAALLGSSALPSDRQIRPHQFRALARDVIDSATVEQRRIFESYTQGVNQGLEHMRQPPFEYLLLRQSPEAWLPEDSVLVMIVLFIKLQDSQGERALSQDALAQHLPSDWLNFMTHSRGQWEAPLTGLSNDSEPISLPETPVSDLFEQLPETYPLDAGARTGSNQWAVSGDLTDHGHGLLANDIHLSPSLPNLWYRASWRLPEHRRHATGATLPGTPVMVVGSNEHIAWGFTASQGDFSDLIRLTVRDQTYLTPDGWEPFEERTEVIEIRGSSAQEMTVRHTRWGPVVGQDQDGRWLALRWAAHDTSAINLDLLDMERQSSVAEALNLNAGIPTQNLMIADRHGDIGWGLLGVLPQRAEGENGPILEGADTPVGGFDFQPETLRPSLTGLDRLWTANNRVIDNALYAEEGAFELGARAQRIRDRLLAIERTSEADMLALQLDDRAVIMDRWRDHLVDTLDAHPDSEDFAGIRAYLSPGTPMHATVDRIDYALVRAYRDAMLAATLGPVLGALDDRLTHTDLALHRVTRTIEYPLWALVTGEPDHLLPAQFDDWSDLRRAVAQRAIDRVGGPDNPQPWGDFNEFQAQHPMSRMLPFLSPLLDTPKQALSGDATTPRVQTPRLSASLRMSVAPGREEQGLFHMPGSQSGHPISPYYRRGHAEWAEGETSPLLPGAPRYQMTLIPQR